MLTFENCDLVLPQSLWVPSSREPCLESSSTVWCPHAGDEIFYHLLPLVASAGWLLHCESSGDLWTPDIVIWCTVWQNKTYSTYPSSPWPLLKPWQTTDYTPTQRDFMQSLSFCAFFFLMPSSHFHQPPPPDRVFIQQMVSTDVSCMRGRYFPELWSRVRGWKRDGPEAMPTRCKIP